MAGRFLSLEEAARHLGVSVDEVNRLVDRKKLFPMRDGATIKFKSDDIERAAADLADGSSQSVASDDLSLSSVIGVGGGGGDELVLDDGGTSADLHSIFGSQADGDSGAHTVLHNAPVGGAKPGDSLSLGSDILGGGKPAEKSLESADLELESIIGASSPSLGGSGAKGGGSGLALDLSDVKPAGGSGLGGGSGAAGLSDVGLSLEGDEGLVLGGSDVKPAGGSVVGSGPLLGSGSLGGSDAGSVADDAFDLGGGMGDEESASVVIATEESGESSFFGAALEDSGSVSLDDSAVGATSLPGGDVGYALMPSASFSVLQVVGLICCSLLLFLASVVMFDVAWTIRAPQGTPLANPLLNAMGEMFGWR